MGMNMQELSINIYIYLYFEGLLKDVVILYSLQSAVILFELWLFLSLSSLTSGIDDISIQSDDPEPKLTVYGHSKQTLCKGVAIRICADWFSLQIQIVRTPNNQDPRLLATSVRTK